MPAPSVEPGHRAATDIAPTDSYLPTDPVWIFRGGAWRPGVIETASSRAATVTYRPNTTRATGVDTLTAQYIAPRDEIDPVLDSATALFSRAGVGRAMEPAWSGPVAEPPHR